MVDGPNVDKMVGVEKWSAVGKTFVGGVLPWDLQAVESAFATSKNIPFWDAQRRKANERGLHMIVSNLKDPVNLSMDHDETLGNPARGMMVLVSGEGADQFYQEFCREALITRNAR